MAPSEALKGKSRRKGAIQQVGKSVESGRWPRGFHAHTRRDEQETISETKVKAVEKVTPN